MNIKHWMDDVRLLMGQVGLYAAPHMTSDGIEKMARLEAGVHVIDHERQREAARTRICAAIQEDIEAAQKNVEDHSRDDPETRAELDGYLRGLRDAQFTARNCGV